MSYPFFYELGIWPYLTCNEKQMVLLLVQHGKVITYPVKCRIELFIQLLCSHSSLGVIIYPCWDQR